MRTPLYLSILFTLLAFSLSGCLSHKPPTQYPEAGTFGLTVVHDDIKTRSLNASPEDLTQALVADLGERQIKSQLCSGEAIDGFARSRDSKQRLELLAANCQANHLLMVELQADFYSQLSGRYRWTVYAQISIVSPEDGDSLMSESYEFPAVLSYDHQREDDAIAAVSTDIERAVNRLIDDYMTSATLTTGELKKKSPEQP